MGKVKVHRTPPSLDMTPMVDLAFLLVTFFMLTATARPDEPVIVDTPSSTSNIQLPDTDVLTITIGDDGKVFFNMDGKFNRQRLITAIGERFKINFTQEEVNRFSLLSSLGMPIGNVKGFLSMEPSERSKVKQPGVPTDSTNNELAEWIIQARLSNPKVRIAIKGDRDANYQIFESVFNTLQENRISRFNLITNLEKAL